MSSFDRLHPKVQKWIWSKGWNELRDVQDRTIPSIMDRNGDTLIVANTSAGKTEAAFLPILSMIADRTEPGLSVLYISPLKALINDQFSRLEELCEAMEIGVVRWHGDAPQSAKNALVKNPAGIALITPESIEALFVRRPERAKKLFADVDFIAIDEVHSFLDDIRGLHLSSLLRRIDRISSKRPRRVGLSATIGDFAGAQKWLNPKAYETVDVIESKVGNPEVQLQIRGYAETKEDIDSDALEVEGDDQKVALDYIADHVFKTCRGTNNLVFAGSRRRVEALTDRLRRRCETVPIPNEFFAHHGSISKDMREPLEKRLKDGQLPTTAVATTTLELGIDIGSLKSIAQIGSPRSLSSLKQRLGRSGRREGESSVIRIYVREGFLGAQTQPLDQLRLDIVASVASVVLLMKGYVEKPSKAIGVATVVLHQVLSFIMQNGGATIPRLYDVICSDGPLSDMSKAEFVTLLKHMAHEKGLVEQMSDGTVMLGREGEFLVQSKDFFAIFMTDDEWTVIEDGKNIGTLPMVNPVAPGGFIAFAGQRWRILDTDITSKVIMVVKDRSATIPSFDPMGREHVSDEFVEAMYEVLKSKEVPSYLDKQGKALLAQGQGAFSVYSLADKVFWEERGSTYLLTWKGTKFNELLALLFIHAGFEAQSHDIGVTITGVHLDEVKQTVINFRRSRPELEKVAQKITDLNVAKYDALVPHEVLASQWAKSRTETFKNVMAFLEKIEVS